MSSNKDSSFKIEHILWMTDHDLAQIISHLPDRTLYELFLKCDPLIRRRILSQISPIRKDYAINGGPWNSEVNEESIEQAYLFVKHLVDELYDSGTIGECPQNISLKTTSQKSK